MSDPVTALVDAYPAFAALPSALMRRVGRDLRPFHADSPGLVGACLDPRRVPFVFEGAAHVALPLPNGRRVPLYTLHRGDWCVLGLTAVEHPHRDLAITAAPEIRGASLSATLLSACFDAHAGMATIALQVVMRRLSELTDVVARLSATTVDQRLATWLLARGPHIQATHQGVADELGTAREVVSRALEHFASEGLVRLGRARIDVADPAGLAGHQCRPID